MTGGPTGESTTDNTYTATIDPGTYQEISGSKLVTVCNDALGYSIYAIGFSGDSYDSNTHTDLIGTGSIGNIQTGTSGSNSYWAMKLEAVTGVTPPTILNSFDNYHVIPSSYTQIAKQETATGSLTDAGASVQTKYKVYVSTSQAAGVYTGKVKYTMVHPNTAPVPTPQPIECDAGKICYAPNAIDVDDAMGDQTASASTDTILWPSNFQRPGYGFIGWNTELDGTGTMYGPMETITTPSTLGTEGLALYATWVQASDYMQNWSGCSSMSIGDVTALTDLRDDDTYAVAKLADGKCWMIENLRLDSTAAHNSDGTMAQGYNSSFVGLATAESPWSYDSVAANSLYSTDGSNNTTIIAGNDLSYRFPRYNNDNTNSAVANQTGNDVNIYSYGNYYTWSAVVADTSNYGNNQTITTTSICPIGWRLPRGGNKTKIESNEHDFWNLIVDGLNNGTSPTNYSSSTQPYYNGATEASFVANALRAFPNNFLYSGNVNSSSIRGRGMTSRYWSSTASGNSTSYHLFSQSNYIYPGTNTDGKSNGYTVRCIVGG